ncbi:MAG: Gfo/Idh/MocA family oxidoreductase [Clostridiales bacterium]|nr:Gfo/Idh/MocA family oxidoreductase [Clostridiales bacterium]
MTDHLRTVVIGYGGMGSQYAQMLYDGKVEGMTLTGVCCRNEPGQQKIRERHPGVAIYRDTEDTFAHASDFDAVVVVTPHVTHVPITAEALALGKHVLCDKPAGICAGEVREVLAKKPQGAVWAIMFNTRMEPASLKAKELLDAGELGEITRAVWVCNSWFRTPAYHRSSPWRSSWSGEYGGLLINQCQHYLDLWQWLLGMPDEVDADIDFGKYNDFTVDDSVDLRFLYGPGSVHPKLRGTFISATGEYPGDNRFEIWGKKGRLTLLDEKKLILDRSEPDVDTFCHTNTEIYGQPEYHTEVLVEPQPGKQYQKVFQNFSDHIRKGTPLLADAANGVNSLTLANAAYLSAWTGIRIALPMDDALYTRLLQDRAAMELKEKNKK